MAKYVVVSVRDRAADVYAVPNFMQSNGVAVRSFTDAVNTEDANSSLWKHPEDFDMYVLGTFDDEEGTFDLLDRPRQIAIGKDVAVRKE